MATQQPMRESDLPQILAALDQAMNPTQAIRDPAQNFLLSCETRPQFMLLLLEIVKNESVRHDLRLMSIISMKNTTSRYWKQRANGGISPQEKSLIRSGIMSIYNHPDDKLAAQLSVLIAKIAREDFPNQWPELLPTVGSILSSNTPHDLRRGLLVLNRVVKELNSKRLAAARLQFSQLSQMFLPPLLTMWAKEIAVVGESCSGQVADTNHLNHSFYMSNYCAKICRRFLSSGVQSIHEDATATSALEFIRSQLVLFLRLKASNPQAPVVTNYVDKTLKLIGKLIIDVQSSHALSMLMAKQLIPLCEIYMTFIKQLINAPDLEPFQQLAVHAMLLLKATFDSSDYADSSNPYVVELGRFWSSENMTALLNLLVNKFFFYTPRDLAEWQEDAESYHIEQGADTWREELRPCAENLYMTMISHQREVVGPYIASFYKHVISQAQTSGDNFNYVILKDSCYRALGLGAYYLYDYIDFTDFFSVVAADASAHYPGGHLLRGRVAWLCGSWVNSLSEMEIRHQVYVILTTLLSDPDICTRLYAIAALRILIDDVAFYADQFIQFLETFMTSAFKMLGDINSLEIKQQILSSLGVIFEQIGDKMRPYIPAIMNALPILWQQSNDNYLMKTTVLTTLQKIVQIAGADCLALGPFLIQVTQYATNPNIPEEAYLAGDALELLLSLARSAPQPTQELMAIFPQVLEAVQKGTEFLMTSIHIMDAYILLGGIHFLQAYGQPLIEFVTSTIGTLKDRPTFVLIDIIEMIIKISPPEYHASLQPLFEKLMQLVFSGSEGDLMTASFIGIFARLIISNSQYFLSLMDSATNNPQNQQQRNYLAELLDIWIDKSDYMMHAAKRRQSAFSLCLLLMTGNPIVLQNIGAILNHSVEAITDASDERLLQEIRILAAGEPDEDGELVTPLVESQRKKAMFQSDIVFTTDLRQYVLQALNTLQQTLGQDTYTRLLGLVDSQVLQQLQQATIAQ